MAEVVKTQSHTTVSKNRKYEASSESGFDLSARVDVGFISSRCEQLLW